MTIVDHDMNKLSKNEITLLSIRLIAVYIFASALGALVSSIVMSASYILEASVISPGTLPLMYAPALPQCLVGVVLWIKAPKISELILPDAGKEETGESLSYETVCTIALSLLGLWILSHSLPGLLGNLAYRYFLINDIQNQYNFDLQGSTFIDIKASNSGGLVKAVSESLLGLWLLLGSNFFISLLKKFRNFGKE